MKRGVPLLLVALFVLPFAHAYIDPGTGGYLISSLWAYVVGGVTFLLAFLIHFFRFTLKRWVRYIYTKHRWIFIAFPLVIIAAIVTSFIYFSADEYRLPDFDPDKVGVTHYNDSAAFEGYNYYDGLLIDMRGNVVHDWKQETEG